ncbi:nuclease-related domain-containing protein [Virgibacillus salinus]|uniref:Nuclease-related domain-containing protein n=1 Tax=Virgibacillus salinus TaxID=553311 RepID=A0A1H0XVK9_9BACI|nr:nuclease-related domain-containing protein [Virgibacillus salinus]SDQ06910.1 Nuclease-related domain-containing protein [Virgibacillus salinus]
MGKLIGRDKLIEQLEQTSSKTMFELKGLRGEIEVGDLLARYLSDDTYIIAQPVIGKYEPDFLIISPTYGFRLIEVKNWSVNSIQGVQTNGTFTIVNGKTSNPLQQVRQHVDDLKGYLLSNYPTLGDTHKRIGYVNIQYGFNRKDLDKYTEDWNEKNAADFYLFHIFKDDLNFTLEKKLLSASKFRSSLLPEKMIKEIVRNITFSNKASSDIEIGYLTGSEDLDQKSNESNIMEKNDAGKEITTNKQKESNSHQKIDVFKIINVGLLIFFVAIGLVIISSGLVSFLEGTNTESISKSNSSIDADKAFTNENVEQGFENPDNLVTVVAMVDDFYYDNKSGNKFLRLQVKDFTFNAIIYSDVETPYINVGERYKFYGITREYEGQIELDIGTVE